MHIENNVSGQSSLAKESINFFEILIWKWTMINSRVKKILNFLIVDNYLYILSVHKNIYQFFF